MVTLFAVVFGVFAMHALTSHHVHHDGADNELRAAAMAEHGHAEAGIEAGAQQAQDPHPDPPEEDRGEGAVMCLALACFVAVLMALALRRGVSTRVLFDVRRWTIVTSRAVGRRHLEPPCLHRLSILRC